MNKFLKIGKRIAETTLIIGIFAGSLIALQVRSHADTVPTIEKEYQNAVHVMFDTINKNLEADGLGEKQNIKLLTYSGANCSEEFRTFKYEYDERVKKIVFLAKKSMKKDGPLAGSEPVYNQENMRNIASITSQLMQNLDTDYPINVDVTLNHNSAKQQVKLIQSLAQKLDTCVNKEKLKKI